MQNCYNKNNLTLVNQAYIQKKFDFKFTEILNQFNKGEADKGNPQIIFHFLIDPITAITNPQQTMENLQEIMFKDIQDDEMTSCELRLRLLLELQKAKTCGKFLWDNFATNTQRRVVNLAYQFASSKPKDFIQEQVNHQFIVFHSKKHYFYAIHFNPISKLKVFNNYINSADSCKAKIDIYVAKCDNCLKNGMVLEGNNTENMKEVNKQQQFQNSQLSLQQLLSWLNQQQKQLEYQYFQFNSQHFSQLLYDYNKEIQDKNSITY